MAPEKKETILEEAQRLTSNDRQELYGHPSDDFNRTAALINAWLGDRLNVPLTAEDVIVCMVMVKLSRQRNMPKRDNIVDAAGYLRLIEMVQERKVQ